MSEAVECGVAGRKLHGLACWVLPGGTIVYLSLDICLAYTENLEQMYGAQK